MTSTTENDVPEIGYFLATVDPLRCTSGEPELYIPHNPTEVYAVYKARRSRFVVVTLPDRYVAHGTTFKGAWWDREDAERFGRSLGSGKEGVGYAVAECQPYYYDSAGCGFVPRSVIIPTEEKRARLEQECRATWANREAAFRRYSERARLEERIRRIREEGIAKIRGEERQLASLDAK